MLTLNIYAKSLHLKQTRSQNHRPMPDNVYRQDIVSLHCESRLRNDLYCVEWDLKLYYAMRPLRVELITISSITINGNTILPQTVAKLTKTSGSEFGDLLWCHLMLRRKTAIWVHNYRVQTLTCTTAPKRFWKNLEKIFSHLYSRRALFDLPKLRMVIEDVVTILKDVNHFK